MAVDPTGRALKTLPRAGPGRPRRDAQTLLRYKADGGRSST